MKLSALMFLFFCHTLFVTAQQRYTLKGSVTDTMATYKLVNTTITILNQKDSTLVKFSRANEEGDFSIKCAAPRQIYFAAYLSWLCRLCGRFCAGQCPYP